MMLGAIVEVFTGLVSRLVDPAVRALVLAAAAGLGLGVFRVKSTSTRLFTWTAVLYAAVAIPLLGWMLPPTPVATDGLLSNAEIRPAPPNVDARPVAAAERSPLPAATDLRPHQALTVMTEPRAAMTPALNTLPTLRIWRSSPWRPIAVIVYLGVALMLLSRIMVGVFFTRRLQRSARRIEDSRLTTSLTFRASACGITSPTHIAESELVSVPVTMGALRSTIILPCDWREWNDAKLDAVIAHEMSHIARRDALTQRLSQLYRAIFWFSPLAWWLDRHLVDLAEQASDEAALYGGADRADYAKTLLSFFEALHAAPGRVWWQGVSMAKAGQAERRLERILAWRGAIPMGMRKSGLRKSVVVAIIAVALPIVYLAASVRPANSSPRTQIPIAPPAAHPAQAPLAQPNVPAPAEAPASQYAPSSPPADAPTGAPPAGPAPVASGAPQAEPPVAPAWDGQSHGSGSSYGTGKGRNYSYAYGYDDEQRFVIVTGKSDALTMSGSMEDAHHVEKLRKRIPGDFIWFQRDEKSYIIRDQATIDRARKLWEPQEELGKKQEELGKQQEALGKQQEEIAAKMEQIQVKVPDMTAELDKLKAELKQLSSGATVEQVGRIQSEIGELQSKMGEIQSHAGDRQSKLGEEMGALGEKQGKLGELQGELGRQQGELAHKASQQMKGILDEAIKNGTAQPEAQEGEGNML